MLNSNIIHSTVLHRNEEINSTTTQSNVDAIDNEAIDLTRVPTDTTILSKTKSDISFALQLDLQRRPRLLRSGATIIKVHKRKKSFQTVTYNDYIHCKEVGLEFIVTYEDRRSKNCTCCKIQYDYGFEHELVKFQVYKWEKQLNAGIQNGKEGGNSQTQLSRSSVG